MFKQDKALRLRLLATIISTVVIVFVVIGLTIYMNSVTTYSHDSLVTTLIVYESCTFATIGALICLVFFNSAVARHNQREVEEKNRELEEAIKDAMLANDSKSLFLSHMSHEMMTPLNGIKGMLKMLADDERFKDNEYLEKSLNSTDIMLGLVNDVLDMSRITNGELTLDEDTVRIESLKRYIASSAEPISESQNVGFICRFTNITCKAFTGDERRIKQIISNVLSNAFRYTPAGGNVTLDMYEENTAADFELHIEIEDSGIGMSKEFLQHAFTPFVQVDPSRENGYGLGLALTGQLIEKMNGKIDIDSEPDRGTRVSIVIPVKPAVQPDSKEDLFNIVRFNGKRALIVEDNKVNMIITSRMFEHLGFNIDKAENGEIALNKYEQSPENYYDIIIMDENMPIMDGLEATKRIRSSGRADSIRMPIIALTANAYINDVSRSFKCGMNEHVCKPVDPNRLVEVLIKYVSSSVISNGRHNFNRIQRDNTSITRENKIHKSKDEIAADEVAAISSQFTIA